MAQAPESKLSTKRIEEGTDDLVKKNRELIERWKALYRQDLERARAQRAAQTGTFEAKAK